MLLKLTLGFGVIVVEVLFPLCGGKLTYVLDKQIFTVVIAEPVYREETFLEAVINRAYNFTQNVDASHCWQTALLHDFTKIFQLGEKLNMMELKQSQ